MKNKEQDLRARVIARAWIDPSYKRKLLTNPRAALKEMGINIPDNIDVMIIEDDSNAFTFVLPPAPTKLKQMSDAELKQLAAAAGDPWMLSPPFQTRKESSDLFDL